MYPSHSFKSDKTGIVIRRNRHCKRVYYYILFFYAVFRGSLVYFAGNLNTLLNCFRDACFTDRKTYYQPSVFLSEREDLVLDILPPVYGIYHGLSVVYPKGAFKSLFIPRIYLKRKVRNSLKLRYNLLHHRRLVYLRKSHVHIQYVSTGLLLREPLLKDIIDIMIKECLLEAFLTCGIDPLSYEYRAFTEKNSMGKGGYHRDILFRRKRIRDIGNRLPFLFDIFRSRPAAASHDVHPKKRHLLYAGSKFIRPHIIDCPAVFSPRKSRIWIYDNGRGCYLHYPLDQRDHLLWSK